MSDTTRAHLQGHSFCFQHVLSNSFQVCLFELQSGDKEGQRVILDVVVGKEQCDVACCMGSAIVVLK